MVCSFVLQKNGKKKAKESVTQIPVPSSDVQTAPALVSGSSAIEIQPVVLLEQGGFDGLLWSLSREVRGKRPGWQLPAQLRVQQRLPHLLVLPCCCLPHHLQLLLYVPKRKNCEKKKSKEISYHQSLCFTQSNLLWLSLGELLESLCRGSGGSVACSGCAKLSWNRFEDFFGCCLLAFERAGGCLLISTVRLA